MPRFWVISLLLASMVSLGQTTETPHRGSVQGVVLDGVGKPLPGATVYALPEMDMLKQIRATTDAAGKFTVNDIPEGGVYLGAFKERDGYPYNFFSFFLMPGERRPDKVNVKAGETTKDVVIQLGAKAAYLSIKITDEHGMFLDEGTHLGYVFTRPDIPANRGYYERGANLKGETLMVPPVPFRLTVEAKGYETWHYGGKGWQGQEGLITLKSGETLNLTIRLKRFP